MPIAVAVKKYSPPSNPDRVFVALTLSGSYVTGGDALNLSPGSWTDPAGVGILGYPERVPTIVPSTFDTAFSGSSVGSYCDVVPGTTLATFKLQIFNPGGSELAASAYPAGIAGQTVTLEVEY